MFIGYEMSDRWDSRRFGGWSTIPLASKWEPAAGGVDGRRRLTRFERPWERINLARRVDSEI